MLIIFENKFFVDIFLNLLLLKLLQRNHRAQFYSRLGSTKLREIPRELAESPQPDSMLKASNPPPLTSTPRKKREENNDEDTDTQMNIDLLDGKDKEIR